MCFLNISSYLQTVWDKTPSDPLSWLLFPSGWRLHALVESPVHHSEAYNFATLLIEGIYPVSSLLNLP